MNFIQAGASLAVIGLLTACAQQEEPSTMVSPEPMFDKHGSGSCVDGYIYVPGTVQEPECIPEDECIEGTQVGAASIPCPPPGRRGGDDDSTSTGGGTPGTPPGSTAP